MTPADLLIDAFDRIRQTGRAAVEGLDDDALAARPTPDANSVGWLVWHLARVQDDHVADVAGLEQVWTRDGVRRPVRAPVRHRRHRLRPHHRPGRPPYGSARTCSPTTSTRCTTRRWPTWARLTDADLDEVVDERWDPPVTRGVRLVSVVSDDLQHAGQAAYVRGLLGS